MLSGEHTGLRAIEPSDLSRLLNWRNQSDLRCYFREFRELSLEQQNQWYDKVNQDASTLMYAVISLTDFKIIGAGGLCYIDWKNRSTELSLYIGHESSYIDDKYAPDAARSLIKYAFEELGLHRIWVEVFDFDAKKQVMLERLGFELEGRHRHTYWTGRDWHDSLFYSLLYQD